jgi:hypothetical protein
MTDGDSQHYLYDLNYLTALWPAGDSRTYLLLIEEVASARESCGM